MKDFTKNSIAFYENSIEFSKKSIKFYKDFGWEAALAEEKKRLAHSRYMLKKYKAMAEKEL